MKIGQVVNFYDPAYGKAQKARIVDITGTGASLAKELQLEVCAGENTGETWEEVPHGTNAVEGSAFWLLPGVEKVPAGWAEHEDPDAPVLPVEKTAGVVAPDAIEEARAATAPARTRRTRR